MFGLGFPDQSAVPFMPAHLGGVARPRQRVPRLPTNIQYLIAAVARSNPTWDEERIAAKLLLKFGIRVSPRTVRRSMAHGTGGRGRGAAQQRWATFVRNHAHALVADGFCVAVTATFRVRSVFVALEVGSRRLVHINVTSHPTEVWTVSLSCSLMPSSDR